MLKIKLHPNAKRDELNDTLADGTIKISLAAPPIGGRANEALIKFLSRAYKVPKSRIKILKGARSRNKIVEIH